MGRRRVGPGDRARRDRRAARRGARPVRPAPAAARRAPSARSLDRFGGAELAATAAAYACLWAELAATERTLAEVLGSARERAREADQLRFGLGEVEAVDPRPGEDVELAAEETRLGFADTLRTAAETAREALSSEEGAPDALGTTQRGAAGLDGVREHDATAGELADRLAELGHLLVDVAGDVASYASSLETDPARLASVSERRAALTALTRKYGETIDEVLAWAEDGAKRLLDLEDTDGQVGELEARRDRLRAELGALAATLTAQRTDGGDAAGRRRQRRADLARDAARHRDDRGLPARGARSGGPAGPVLLVDGRWLRARSHGVDDVEFLLAANTGADARPLHKGASGGELSRVMLALEVSLAETGSVPTFVFDEVDAGVGGKAAIEVGRRLAALARTLAGPGRHPPAPGGGVRRPPRRGRTSRATGRSPRSGLATLDEAERERELSRMLAGVEDSDSARAHARELLGRRRARAGVPPRRAPDRLTPWRGHEVRSPLPPSPHPPRCPRSRPAPPAYGQPARPAPGR